MGLPGVLLCACAYVDPDPEWHLTAAAVVASEVFTAAPAPDCATQLRPGGTIAVGDRVRYGLQLEAAGGREQWLVDLEVRAFEEAGADRWVRLDVVSRAADGRELACDQPAVRADDLTVSLWAACAGHGDRARADRALGDLLRVMRRSPALSDVLWRVVDRPSALSVIAHLGVHVRKHSRFGDSRGGPRVEIGGVGVDTFALPIEVRVNGVPALRAIVLVTEPHAPLSLGAGVVALHAWRPSDPGVTFGLRLLSAQCGAAGVQELQEPPR